MAAPSATDPGPDFDPYTQILNLLTPSEGPIPIAVSDIDAYVNYAVSTCINYSTQIGASLILLLCLLLTTKPEKRTSIIFILNAFALFFNFIRSICQCFYFTGQFYEFYSYFASDFSTVPQGQYGASIAGLVFTLLVVICVETSLVLQVHVILDNPTVRRLHRMIVVGICVLIILTVLGLRLALTIENAIYIMAAEDFSQWIWLEKAVTYSTAASIVIFSLIFVVKLAVALRRRRNTLSMGGWGPMEIIFTMACCTLIVPAVFAILQTFSTVPEFKSQMLTVTTLFLPLSSMWAAASIDNSQHVNPDMQPKKSLHNNIITRFKKPATDEEASTATTQPSTAYTATTNSDTPSSTTKHKRTYSSSARSTYQANNSPVNNKHQAKTQGLMDEDEKDDLDGELRMYAGRSFGVTQERFE